MSSVQWLEKNGKEKWTKELFDQYVGTEHGKWCGVIERIMVGNNWAYKVKTMQLIKNNIENVNDEKLAITLYHFVVGAILDHCDQVVKEAILLYKYMLHYLIFRKVSNDTIKLILIEIVVSEWKELRFDCYDVFCLDSLDDRMISSLFTQFVTIYPLTDQIEKERLIKTIILLPQHCRGSFQCFDNEFPNKPFEQFTTYKEVFVSLFLMNYSSSLANSFISKSLQYQLNSLSPELCPLQIIQRELTNLPPTTILVKYIDSISSS
ncbi:hypothetical protein ENUP19_0044G0030 [Entamoeba nuttalli]|uniref:Uncharacterized protein n=1 Tax=Entamoeba nuttalli TaxID=412467 RepID=A0ABQ0DAH5_9EUKA